MIEDRMPRRDALVLAGVMIVAAVVRFATLDAQSFWFDEALTLRTINGSWGVMFDQIDQQAVPPLYFLLARGWTRIFGDGEVGLRSLSAAAGVLTVPVAYSAAKTLVTRNAGLVSAGLVAISPPLIWYSQEARSYSLLVLLCAISLMFFARAWREPTPRNLAGWVVASALAMTAHYFAVFVVVPEAVWLIAASARDRRVPLAVGGLSLAGLALAPYALYQREHGGAEWIGNFPFGERLREAVRFLATGMQHPGARIAGVVVLAAVVAVGLALRHRTEARRGALVALGLGAATVVIPIAVAPFGSDYVLDRNLLAAWVPLAIGVAAGLSAAPSGGRVAAALGLGAALAICAVFIRQDVRLATWTIKDDWRTVATRLGPGDADRVIVVIPRWQSAALLVYLGRTHSMNRPRAVSEIDVVEYAGTLPHPDKKARIAPGAPFRPAGRFIVERLIVVTRYRAPRPSLVEPGSLYVQGRNGAGPFLQARERS